MGLKMHCAKGTLLRKCATEVAESHTTLSFFLPGLLDQSHLTSLLLGRKKEEEEAENVLPYVPLMGCRYSSLCDCVQAELSSVLSRKWMLTPDLGRRML
jgi:hypothetical protein